MKTIITIIKITVFTILGLGLAACSGNPSKAPTSKSSQAASYNARLGAEYTRKGRLNLANEKLQKALEQDPRSTEAHHYFALLKQKLGDNAEADKHFRTAMRLNPKDPQLLNNYGSHLCNNGYYAEASKQFMAALKDPLYTTPEFAYTNAGICIKKSGNAVKAESLFRQSLDVKPTFGSALFQMAKLKFEQGDHARAQAFLQRYHDKHRVSAETLDLCVKINTQLGEPTAGQCSSSPSDSFFGNN